MCHNKRGTYGTMLPTGIYGRREGARESKYRQRGSVCPQTPGIKSPLFLPSFKIKFLSDIDSYQRTKKSEIETTDRRPIAQVIEQAKSLPRMGYPPSLLAGYLGV